MGQHGQAGGRLSVQDSCDKQEYCSNAQEPCSGVNKSLLLGRKLTALCRSTVAVVLWWYATAV